MHNGVIGGFMGIRRAMLALLCNDAYETVQSFHSDSAVAFALFLHLLPDLQTELTPVQLLQAMEVRASLRGVVLGGCLVVWGGGGEGGVQGLKGREAGKSRGCFVALWSVQLCNEGL